MNPKPDLERITEISDMLGDASKMPIDIVPLNLAPAKLRLKALLNVKG